MVPYHTTTQQITLVWYQGTKWYKKNISWFFERCIILTVFDTKLFLDFNLLSTVQRIFTKNIYYWILSGNTNSLPGYSMRKHSRVTTEYSNDLVNQKKLREGAFDNIFLASLFEPVARRNLRQKYQSSEPYRHLSIYPACNDFRLRCVLKEVKEQLHATFKETDLF